MNDSTKKLTEYFTKFPGIGSRQARRFVYFLLSQKKEFVTGFVASLSDIKESIKQCASCYRFFEGSSSLCDICESKITDTSTLMIVEKDIDFENIKKSGIYHGRYFILGGLLSILEKTPMEKIRIRELVKEIGKQVVSSGLKEVIIALSANLEGDNTYQYIKKTIEPLKEKHKLKISSLGRGLSTGLELEYSDGETLGNALKNRN
ncbi:MAG: toprim domain-containing protein [Patescibacteria group bacterium]